MEQKKKGITEQTYKTLYKGLSSGNMENRISERLSNPESATDQYHAAGQPISEK
jgi:hypothetical protein